MKVIDLQVTRSDMDIRLPDGHGLAPDEEFIDLHVISEELDRFRQESKYFRGLLPQDLGHAALALVGRGVASDYDAIWCLTHEELGDRLADTGFTVHGGVALSPLLMRALATYDRGKPVVARIGMKTLADLYLTNEQKQCYRRAHLYPTTD